MTRPLRPPAFLLALAFLAAFLVQCGHLGSVDASRRLQVARSFWTDEPPVVTDDTGFGIPGRSGRMEAWYGMGQSLVMLPFDVAAASLLSAVPPLKELDGRLGGTVGRALVAYPLAALICVLGVAAAFRLLLALDFDRREAVWGSVALLFASTFLHYTQVLQENGPLFTLAASAACLHLRWAREGGSWRLAAGLTLLGLALLTRLTAALDFAAVVALVFAVLVRGGQARRACRYVIACAAGGVVALAADRLYHFARFGSWTDTYIGRFGQFWKATRSGLPESFPFSNPFWDGFLGPLVTPEKSVFLFDPLLILAALLAWRCRGRLPFALRAFLVAQSCLLLAYVCFYARYFDWSGDSAWGDRFVTAPVQMICLAAGAMLARYGRELGRLRRPAYAVVILAVAVQLSSVFFSYNLERIQRAVDPGRTRFVVALRAKNIAAYVTANQERWGLAEGVPPRELSANLTPFGPLPEPARKLAVALWLAALAAVWWALARLFNSGDFRHPQS
jgi:hypothetical protein